MLVTTFTYEFGLQDGERMKGGSLWTKASAETEQPTFRGSHTELDLESVDTVLLSDDRSIKVFWAKDIFGQGGDPLLLMKESYDLALIVNCEGETWIVRSEPTLDDRIGLSIANKEHKVLFTGLGDLVEVNEPVQAHQLIASFQQVYSWRRSSPKACAHCHGAIRKGGAGSPDGGQ